MWTRHQELTSSAAVASLFQVVFYAFIRYVKDGIQAIVPVSLIKRFRPKHVDDFDPKCPLLVYWKSKDGQIEDYYRARVLILGGKDQSQ